MGEKSAEELELDRGEVDAAAGAPGLEAPEVDLDVIELADLGLLIGACRGAAQGRLDACLELAPAERLGDVIVSAQLEAQDFIDPPGRGR